MDIAAVYSDFHPDRLREELLKDGEVFHQIYKGSKSRQEMYQMIADTLTILTTGGEYHA